MERKRTDVTGLPPGWKREEIIRKSGLSAGKTDVYYFSPDGRKVRSKPALARLLGDKIDMAAFDFRAGRMHQMNNVHKRLRHDAGLVLPIRQTASIFKQPVIVVRNHPDSKTRTDLRHGVQEQPRQLFWEKRLQGLVASNPHGEPLNPLQLPSTIQGSNPELLGAENLLQSIAAALHLSNQAVIGQNVSKTLLQRNPAVNINTEQPLIQNFVVSEQDINKQEMKVQDARRRLQLALSSLSVASLNSDSLDTAPSSLDDQQAT